jgi:hypothetical protein
MEVIERDEFLGFFGQSTSDYERVRSYDLLELGRKGRIAENIRNKITYRKCLIN